MPTVCAIFVAEDKYFFTVNVLKTRDISLSGLFAAVAVIILYMGSLIPDFDLAAAAIAGVIPAVICAVTGVANGFMNFLATAILAFILLPSKRVGVEYLFVFGIYPLMKIYIDRLRKPVVAGIIKALFSNAVIIICMQFFAGLFLAPEFMGKKWKMLAIIVLNIVFWIYDAGMSKILFFCIRKARFLTDKR